MLPKALLKIQREVRGLSEISSRSVQGAKIFICYAVFVNLESAQLNMQM